MQAIRQSRCTVELIATARLLFQRDRFHRRLVESNLLPEKTALAAIGTNHLRLEIGVRRDLHRCLIFRRSGSWLCTIRCIINVSLAKFRKCHGQRTLLRVRLQHRIHIEDMLRIVVIQPIIQFSHAYHTRQEVLIVFLLGSGPLHLSQGIHTWQHHVLYLTEGRHILRPKIRLRTDDILLLLWCEGSRHRLKAIDLLQRQVTSDGQRLMLRVG